MTNTLYNNLLTGVFGGDKYETYFKYINSYNLSSFYCDRNDDYSNGINYAKSLICCYVAYNNWFIRHY